jgi:DNA repair exonuclease SbcCD ATPase subunit
MEQPTDHGTPLLQESIKEFQALLEGFYMEQRHRNEMSQSISNRDDVLWLFEELEWRFEEIRRGYEEEWTRWNRNFNDRNVSLPNDTSVDRFHVEEYKTCLRGLMEVVASHRSSANHAHHDSLDNLKNEVHSLRQQLSSHTLHHEQTCRKLHGEIETMKQNHKTMNDEQSKTIELLESKIAQQNETMDNLQQDGERVKSALDQERQMHNLSKERMTARLHYLEGIVRSLTAERKEENMARRAMLPCPRGNDDTSSPVHASLLSPFSTTSLNGLESNVSRKDEKDSSLILCLEQQIEELGTALQQSEEERANAIEEFQYEREQYIRQYREMSDLLKRFLDSDNANCNDT